MEGTANRVHGSLMISTSNSSKTVQGRSGWWFQIFVIFTHPEIWGNDPIWWAYFSDGLKPPTGDEWLGPQIGLIPAMMLYLLSCFLNRALACFVMFVKWVVLYTENRFGSPNTEDISHIYIYISGCFPDVVMFCWSSIWTSRCCCLLQNEATLCCWSSVPANYPKSKCHLSLLKPRESCPWGLFKMDRSIVFVQVLVLLFWLLCHWLNHVDIWFPLISLVSHMTLFMFCWMLTARNEVVVSIHLPTKGGLFGMI